MPRIDDNTLDCCIFLYRSTGDAEQGTNTEGSGFVVGYPSLDFSIAPFHHLYAVTNCHVARVAPVARLNKANGTTDTFGTDITDWEYDEDADIAVLPLPITDFRQYKIQFIGESFFLNQDECRNLDIGIGDDVFMIGHLVDHARPVLTNKPYVRFGHISKMPEKSVGKYKKEDGYMIDMRSRVGFSGSPVFCYRNPHTNLNYAAKMRGLTDERGFFHFLGIHWGGLPEKWKISGVEVDTRGMSGMTVVSPAWELLRILERDVLKMQRESDDKVVKPLILKERKSGPDNESASN